MNTDQKSTYVVLTEALDDVVEVGTGLLAVLGHVLRINHGLLLEDVHLGEVLRILHRAQGLLSSDNSRLLTSHRSFGHLQFIKL